MKTFLHRLDDICKAEERGYHRHYEILGQVLFGLTAGAALTGGISVAVGAVGIVASVVFYFAGMKISEAHGDSIVAFRRDFKAVMDDLELIEGAAAGSPATADQWDWHLPGEEGDQ
jgi:hypothetical protein